MKNVQDIYPASPMQEFMLLHGLSHSGQDTLFSQLVFSVNTAIQPQAFERAWNQVVEAHTALRTAFIWQGVDSPQQVVRQKVSINCDVVDLSSQDGLTQDSTVLELLVQDRKAGFDFRRAPLTRFKLIKLSETNWRVVWSSHHLIIDRWCIDQLIEEFQRYYVAHLNSSPVPTRRAPSYRDYIAWIQQQDSQAAHDHWHRYLKGFDRPTTVTKMCRSDYLKDEPNASQASHPVGSGLTRQAREFSAQVGVTLGCIVQAALALVINKLIGQRDIVFGVTVAGRPAAVAHVEEIVGSFISTLPVRVQLDENVTVSGWLRGLNAAQFSNAGYDYLSPAQLGTCSSVPADQGLFDLLMVWLAETNVQSKTVAHDGLPLVPVSEQYKTAYPLTLSVIETSDDLILRADTSAAIEFPLSGFLRSIIEALESLVLAVPELTLQQFKSLDFQSDNRVAVKPGSAPPGYIKRPGANALSRSRGREAMRVDAMQDMLRGEWQSVLGIDSTIGLDDDFFELGGNSLQAAALHTRIEAATRKAIPLLALYEKPTLQGMAATLIHEKWPLTDGIAVPLQMGSTGATLFCIASPEVNTLGYAMLARHLSGKRNLVLLQAPPRSDSLEQLHPDDLSGYATDYVEALRDVQPSGPYFFISMCAGAHIAYQMIRQLEKEGQQVCFAGVINTWSLYSISRRFYLNRLVNITKYYRQRMRAMVKGNASGLTAKPVSVGAADSEQNAAMTGGSSAAGVLPADAAVGLDNPWIKRVGFADRMPDDQQVSTNISVFRLANQPYWRVSDSTLGWSRLAGQASVVRIEADHHNSILREPYVTEVAKAMENQITAAEATLRDEGA